MPDQVRHGLLLIDRRQLENVPPPVCESEVATVALRDLRRLLLLAGLETEHRFDDGDREVGGEELLWQLGRVEREVASDGFDDLTNP